MLYCYLLIDTMNVKKSVRRILKYINPNSQPHAHVLTLLLHIVCFVPYPILYTITHSPNNGKHIIQSMNYFVLYSPVSPCPPLSIFSWDNSHNTITFSKSNLLLFNNNNSNYFYYYFIVVFLRRRYVHHP